MKKKDPLKTTVSQGLAEIFIASELVTEEQVRNLANKAIATKEKHNTTNRSVLFNLNHP
jgi:hypothetical protein